MAYRLFTIPPHVWTPVPRTALEVWHNERRGQPIGAYFDGSLRVTTSGVVWLVRAVTQDYQPTILET